MKSAILFLVATSMMASPSFAADPVKQCRDSVKSNVESCKAAGAKAVGASNQGATLVGAQAQNQFGNSETGKEMSQLGNASAALMTEANGICETSKTTCQQTCDKAKSSIQPNDQQKVQKISQIDEAKKTCEDAINQLQAELSKGSNDAMNAANQAQNTSEAATGGAEPVSGGGGSGASPMMAGVLGAAIGAAAGYFFGKKQGEKEAEKNKTPLINADGSVNCAASGAEAYSDCNEDFVTKCANTLSDPVCVAFSDRYCSSSSSSTAATVNQSANGVIIASAEDKDIKGEGIGSNFCFTVLASNYCKTSGRTTCPSCLQLQTNQSEACKKNPALCIAQNSLADIEAAKKTCPTDPLFSNPVYASGGGSTIPSELVSGDDPILPTGSLSSSSAQTASVIGASPASLGGASSRSAQNRLGGGAVGGGAASSSGQNGRMDVASSGGTESARAPASNMQVGTQMGPSVFAMSSEMISSRCRQRQFVHCK